MLTSKTGAPANYEELFEHYWHFVRGLVARMGIAPQEVEDVAADILTKFIARDGLSWYDPEMLHEVSAESKHGAPKMEGPKFRPAKFQGMLRSYVVKSCLNARDKQQVYNRRIVLNLDSSDVGTSGTSTHYDSDMLFSDIEFEDEVKRAHAYLASLPVQGNRDLAYLFLRSIAMLEHEGKISRKCLAEEMGISSAVLLRSFAELRLELDSIGLSPQGWVPKKRVVRLPKAVSVS